MSDRIMQRLAGGGRTGVFLAVIALTLIALFLPGIIGALLLALIVAGLATLMARTWVVTAPRARAIRIPVLVGLAVIAVVKVMQ